MASLDIRYIAGLFDGEGCISLHTDSSGVPERYKKPRKVFQVSITNTYKPVLLDLKRQFGCGSVHRNSKPKKAHYKQCYSWTVTGGNAMRFLELIEPYLRIKGAKARRVLGNL